MRWVLYRWIWQLRAPLHIGYTPAGALNRTRLYIPARNMWAAFTAEIARRQADSAFPDYKDIGQKLQEYVRFTYLFPAERVDNRWYAWLPRYEEEDGLCWYREDGPKEPDRRFRRRLLYTRPSTAIAPGSGAAEEGTLREVEYIATHWKPAQASRRDSSPVAFVGYMFLKNTVPQTLEDVLKDIREVFIGGETRYGFGRLKLIPFAEQFPWEETHTCFGYKVLLAEREPQVNNPSYLMAHGSVTEAKGEWEILFRWDWQAIQVENHPLWKPGSLIANGNSFAVRPDGLWQVLSSV